MSKKQKQQRRKRKSKAQQAASRRIFTESSNNDFRPALPLGRSGPSAPQASVTTTQALLDNDQRPPRTADAGQTEKHGSSQTLEIAMAALRRKRYSQAAEFLQQVLESDPVCADAWSALSLAHLGREEIVEAEVAVETAIACGLTSCAHQLGFGIEMFREQEFRQAEHCFRLATKIQPEMCEAHNNLANAAHRQGRFRESIVAYDKALELQPQFLSALYNRAVALKQIGDLEAATKSLESVIAIDPNYVDALCNLGQISQLQKRPQTALKWFERAGQRRPENADIPYCQANLCLQLSRYQEAADHYQRALELNPNHPDALNNLGACLAKMGRDDKAQDCFLQALALDDHFAPALENLGDLHCRLGQFSDAISYFTRILDANPDNPSVLLKQGRTLTQAQNFEAAEQVFRAALRLQPESPQPLAELGMVASRVGNADDAKSYLDRAVSLAPNDPQLAYSRAITLPVIYDEAAQVGRERAALVESMDQLREREVRLDPTKDSVDTLFYLAYQGGDDRQIQTAAASLFQQRDLTQGRRCQLDRPLRVGFLTRFWADHTVGLLTGGLMSRLDSEKITTITLSVNSRQPWFEANTDEFHALPNNAKRLTNQVASLDLDILVYPEVGMDPLTNLAARTRLAPIQCAMWGHPVTTGIPVMDYFVSSSLLEVEGAQAHYSEQLALLETLPAYYFRPRLDQPLKSREDLGLPTEGVLYGCPQSLFKMHPEFDELLDRILDHDPRSQVVLIEGNRRPWTERLKSRLARTMQHADRVLFLPRLSGQDFYSLLCAVDVALDPLHFGGGRSHYLTMAAGTPLITLPSEFMRGRVASGMYRKLGLTDCVADSRDSYVAKAAALGECSDFRTAVGESISSRSQELFEDQAAVQAFEQFLLQAAHNNAERS